MNQITAKNYIGQAVMDFLRFTPILQEQDYHSDSEVLQKLAVTMKKGQCFSIPDGGRFLDDGLRGLIGEELRLPYPTTVVEVFDPKVVDDVITGKFIIIAQEVTTDTDRVSKLIRGRFGWDTDMFLSFICLGQFYNESRTEKVWWPMPVQWFVPCQGAWPESEEEEQELQKTVADLKEHFEKDTDYKVDTAVGLKCRCFPLLCDYIEDFFGVAMADQLEFTQYAVAHIYGQAPVLPESIMTEEKFLGFVDMLHQSQSFIYPIFELCEALTCSNVSTQIREQVSNKTNRKRMKKGKAPLIETRILVIETPVERDETTGEPTGRTHASPRQHLRRGHIRRYKSGLKIWINSCVVGRNNPNGYIDKKYTVH